MTGVCAHALDRLNELAQPPENIFFTGSDLHQLDLTNATAIVGSRDCSQKGLENAFNLSKKLASEGNIIISGLALGIDSSVFEGALSVDGVCIAVLPSSVDIITPKSNTHIAKDIIAKRGCLISEYPESSVAKKFTYIRRNELIAALSSNVILAEARENGGAWYTVRAAWKLGRPVSRLGLDGVLHPLSNPQKGLF